MIRLTIDEAAARLSSLSRALILFHVRPDGDAVGTAFALRAALAARGCDAWCICAEEVPARLRFLLCPDGDTRLDPVQPSVLLESVPAHLADAPIVAVDTASPAQAGALVDLLDRCVLMLDHHAKGTPFADFCIDPDAAACAELLSRVLARMDAPLTPEIAACLYAAIASDSGCFKYSNTTASTHETAAVLHRALAGHVLCPDEICRRLFDCKPLAVLRAESIALSNLRRFADGRVCASSITDAERRAAGITAADTDTMIDAIRVLEGCEIAVVIKQLEDSCLYRASMRSIGPDVAHVAEKFGGGGHIRAAGCTLDAPSAEAALEMLVAAIPMPL